MKFSGFHATIQPPSTSGTYYLLLGSSWTDTTGQILGGSASSPLPVGVDFTINTASYLLGLSGNGAIKLYDTEPSFLYCKLTAPASSGATVLNVDRDVTAGNSWLATTRKTVDVCNVNAARQVNSMTIASATSTTITLTAGLTNAMATGAYVVLTARHVQMIGSASLMISGTINGVFQCAIIHSGSSAIGGTAKNCQMAGVLSGGGGAAFNATIGTLVTGAVTNRTAEADFNSTGIRVSGIIAGCAIGFSTSINAYLSGIIAGCTSGFSACTDAIVNGLITGCTQGLLQTDAQLMASAVFNNNGVDVGLGTILGRGATLASSSQVNFSSGQSSTLPLSCMCDIWQNGGVAGARKTWTTGGTAYTQSGTAHPAYGAAYQFAPTVAIQPTFMQDEYMVDPGTTVSICVWAQVSTGGMAPLAQLFTPDQDPMYGGTAQAATTFNASTTGSWQVQELFYTNTSSYPIQMILRASCMAASGNMYMGWRRQNTAGVM